MEEVDVNDKQASTASTSEDGEGKCEDPVQKEEEEDEWMDILGSGQLKKKIVKPAVDSYRPERSHVCLVNIEGKLANGTVVEKLPGFHFQIGDGEVIQGLDLALPLMYVGEEALIEVGPRFAYGTIGKSPDVPPGETLFYKVELLSAEPERDLETVPASERKIIGNRKRERGNWWFSRNEHILAIQCYRRALEYLDDVEGGIIIKPDNETNLPHDEELHELLEDRLKVYNNLAAAQLKINAYDAALMSVQNVLSCQPNNVKALFRKGKILAAKGQHAESLAVLRTACQLEPDDKVIRLELNRIANLQKVNTNQEKNLYKKMLGQKKEEVPLNNQSSRQSLFYPWAMIVAGTAITVAGVIAFRYKYL